MWMLMLMSWREENAMKPRRRTVNASETGGSFPTPSLRWGLACLIKENENLLEKTSPKESVSFVKGTNLPLVLFLVVLERKT